MPKRKKTKPKTPRPRPRAARKDEKGIPLTSDQRRFTILPSDFAEAMRAAGRGADQGNAQGCPARQRKAPPPEAGKRIQHR